MSERFTDRIMRVFGSRLRTARKDAGFKTAREFAEALGVEPPRYRYWERGEALPDLVHVARICRILKRDPNYFMPDAMTTAEGNEGGRTAA